MSHLTYTLTLSDRGDHFVLTDSEDGGLRGVIPKGAEAARNAIEHVLVQNADYIAYTLAAFIEGDQQ